MSTDVHRSWKQAVSLGLVVVAVAAVWFPISAVAPTRLDPESLIPRVHIYLCLLAMTAVAVASAIGSRRESEAVLVADRWELQSVVEDRTRALIRSEERFRTLLDNLPDPVLLFDDAGRIFFVNERACRVLGYSSAELQGMTFDQIDALGRCAPRTLVPPGATDPGPTVTRLRRRGGSVYPAEVSAREIEFDGAPRILAIARDITRRLEVEQRLSESERMVLLGMEAGGIAHDFNNVLVGIMGHTELARAKLPVNSPAEVDLRTVLCNVDRARKLLRGILSAGRRESEVRLVDLADTVRDVLQLLRPKVHSRVRDRLDVRCDKPMVRVDQVQLERVLLNLLTNALHAMRLHGGELTITLEDANLNQPDADRLRLQSGSFIRVTIADTGDGMDAATLSRVFDPFFTTKVAGEGTGLGMPVVQHIVRGMRGVIDIDSGPGEGTRVSVYLPRHDDPAS